MTPEPAPTTPDYPAQQRADDLDSLLAQVEALTNTAALVARLTSGSEPVDLLYLEEKAQAAERHASAVARDARGILERQHRDRWLNLDGPRSHRPDSKEVNR